MKTTSVKCWLREEEISSSSDWVAFWPNPHQNLKVINLYLVLFCLFLMEHINDCGVVVGLRNMCAVVR